MSTNSEATVPPAVEGFRLWSIASLLTVALILNYADRLVFNQNASQIKVAFGIQDQGYGLLSGAFSQGFAWGGLVFGVLADVIPVRWLYPCVVLLWSVLDMSRAEVREFDSMWWCQFLMGLFMAGHWPCALRTTQRLFNPAQRAMANSLLQSGASVGNILTPLLVLALYEWDPEKWRWGFHITGAMGAIWIAWWLGTIRPSDLDRPVQTGDTALATGTMRDRPFVSVLFSGRWVLLLLTVVSINCLWHYVVAWMPSTLEKRHHYSHEFTQKFTSLFYVGTFVGNLFGGWIAAQLPKRGWSVHSARLAVFAGGCVFSLFAIPAAYLPAGRGLLGSYLMISLGSLALFPIYYSLNQELSAKHQGKVGGSLSFCSWMILSQLHAQVGKFEDVDPRQAALFFAILGILPSVAGIALWLGWKRGQLPSVP